MADPLKTKLSLNARAPRPLVAAFAAALGIGLMAGLAPVQAQPMASGLTSPGLVTEVGWRRYNKKRWLYSNQYVYVPDSYAVTSTNPARAYVPYWAQSDEIRELRRAFPSTNWPPSDRY